MFGSICLSVLRGFLLMKKSGAESTTDVCNVGFPGDWAMVFFYGCVTSVLHMLGSQVRRLLQVPKEIVRAWMTATNSRNHT